MRCFELSWCHSWVKRNPEFKQMQIKAACAAQERVHSAVRIEAAHSEQHVGPHDGRLSVTNLRWNNQLRSSGFHALQKDLFVLQGHFHLKVHTNMKRKWIRDSSATASATPSLCPTALTSFTIIQSYLTIKKTNKQTKKNPNCLQFNPVTL